MGDLVPISQTMPKKKLSPLEAFATSLGMLNNIASAYGSVKGAIGTKQQSLPNQGNGWIYPDPKVGTS